MKQAYRVIWLLMMAVWVMACGDPAADPQPVNPQYLVLSSQSIAEGEEVNSYDVSELVLTYNKMIRLSKSASVTLNNAKVEVVTSATTAKIALPLEAGEAYVLTISEGAFVSTLDSTITSQAFELNFTTKPDAGAENITDHLSNANATQQAVNVYNFLLSQYGKKTLLASMANVNWNIAEAELVHAATGKYPAIATMDYIHMFTLTSHNPFEYWTVAYDNLSVVENWWNSNGLIAASWHWNMPATENHINSTEGYTCTPGAGSTDPQTTCAKPSNIMKDGTWEKRIADEDLAKMAELLLALQTKGIPLIFRPFHEASGNTYSPWNLVNGKPQGNAAWFWWGAEGAETYKQLWRYVYDYMKDAGVNNLIWVWTSQNNGDNDWYPGDEYVDMIGQDIYNQGCQNNAADFKKLQAAYPNKMITLSECGNVGKVSEQWTAGARWSYCMPWYQYNAATLEGHEYADTQWWQDAVNCKNVITRDQMPSLK